MNRKKIALGSLLVFLSFSLTGCPRYGIWDRNQDMATEQGTIHELAIIDNSFGLFLDRGYTKIMERIGTSYHDGMAIEIAVRILLPLIKFITMKQRTPCVLRFL